MAVLKLRKPREPFVDEPEKYLLKPKPSSDLFARAMKGGWWIFGSRIIQQLMAMIRLVVLARVLKPEDFGLLALAQLAISILNQFSATGFSVALIQKNAQIEDYLNSAWTFGIIRGIVLYCILFIAAPFVAIFFNSPDVTPIIRVIGISAIFTPFYNIGIIFFQKELDFKKQSIFTNLGTAANVTVAIVLAFIYKSVWALVAGQFASMIVRLICSYALHSYRPRLQLKWDKIREMWKFGKHIMVNSIIDFFCLEGDDVILGKMLGIHVLGLYRYAYKVSNMMATEIGDLVGRVSFPTFSKLQDNLEKLRAGYVKSSQVVMLIVCPISGGLIILAHELILVVFGIEWIEMATAMQILCLLGVAKCNQGASVLYSMNRPDVTVWISSLRFITIVLTIYPLTKMFGMAGTAASVTFSAYLFFPVQLYYVKQLIGHPFRDYIKLLSLPVLATLCMMLVVFFTRISFEEIGILTLILLITVGALSYCIFILSLVRFYKEYNLAEIIKNLAGGLK